ncbi:MFS transporter [Stagnihabitans tardus]|uniref:MFS transporter n=1 Tax=Stagnihabitans tardus TaxID=2699202 RepID=A0AAE4YAP9_9RHOB|nr:MFS transporter [Stagnihabitans tardus]NBZ88434.1 MFS transporter [Stagnihabitans tardus]
MSSARPLWHFAALAGLEASVRGSLISVMPLVVREAMGSTVGASEAYFLVGLVSLSWGLMVPAVTRLIPRGHTYSAGCCLYLLATALAYSGAPLLVTLALACNSMATATTFVCFNAYVLDNVERENLGKVQSLQMVVAAAPWTLGPVGGVWLHDLWAPAPFLLAGAFALAQLVTFQLLRLGHGRQIAKAEAQGLNPLAYLARFAAQPRLIAGWSFAVIRSTGWWVYVVYLPYFCIEQGLGPNVGGTALSISNAMLIFSPVILRFARKASVRISVRRAFALCGALFLAAALISPWPWGTVAALMAASVLLVALDVVGGLPFLMSVKPSQRTEMSAIYSSFRDVSSVVTPGMAWAVLLVAPTAGIFAATAALMGGAFLVAGRLHPRLGTPRPSRGGELTQ